MEEVVRRYCRFSRVCVVCRVTFMEEWCFRFKGLYACELCAPDILVARGIFHRYGYKRSDEKKGGTK